MVFKHPMVVVEVSPVDEGEILCPKKKSYTHEQSLYVSHTNPLPGAMINLLCFYRFCLFWTFHLNGIMRYGVFCFWLLSLSNVFKVHPSCRVYQNLIPFLLLNNISFIYGIYHILSIYSSVDGHLCHVPLLVVMNNAV